MTVQATESIPIISGSQLEDSPRRKSDMTFNELLKEQALGNSTGGGGGKKQNSSSNNDAQSKKKKQKYSKQDEQFCSFLDLTIFKLTLCKIDSTSHNLKRCPYYHD